MQKNTPFFLAFSVNPVRRFGVESDDLGCFRITFSCSLRGPLPSTSVLRGQLEAEDVDERACIVLGAVVVCEGGATLFAEGAGLPADVALTATKEDNVRGGTQVVPLVMRARWCLDLCRHNSGRRRRLRSLGLGLRELLHLSLHLLHLRLRLHLCLLYLNLQLSLQPHLLLNLRLLQLGLLCTLSNRRHEIRIRKRGDPNHLLLHQRLLLHLRQTLHDGLVALLQRHCKASSVSHHSRRLRLLLCLKEGRLWDRVALHVRNKKGLVHCRRVVLLGGLLSHKRNGNLRRLWRLVDIVSVQRWVDSCEVEGLLRLHCCLCLLESWVDSGHLRQGSHLRGNRLHGRFGVHCAVVF